MSGGDHLERLEALLTPTATGVMFTEDGVADLCKALDELKQLRDFRDAIVEAQVSLQSSSFYVGWLKGFNAMPTAGVYTQAHLDTVAYAEELHAVNAKAVPQQPAPDGDVRAVRALTNATGRMLTKWAEADEAVRREMWTEVHDRADVVDDRFRERFAELDGRFGGGGDR